MKNIYQSLIGFKGNAEEFHDYIQKLKLMDVFGNMYVAYQKKYEAKKAILFIVSVYSIYSDLLEFGTRLEIIKERAAEQCELDEFMRDELVELKLSYETKATERKGAKSGDISDVEAINEDDGIEELVVNGESKYRIEKIITTIDNFLKYQDDPILYNILRKKDHYDQVSRAAHRQHLKNDKGDVDWELKMKLNNQADKLLQEIEEWENKLRERNKAIQPQVRDMEQKRKVFTSVRVEHAISNYAR